MSPVETVLVIDNYDSFTYNLVQYLGELGEHTVVRRNDQITLSEVTQLQPVAAVLSPGPKTPSEAGICNDLLVELGPTLPTLGVCLGTPVSRGGLRSPGGAVRPAGHARESVAGLPRGPVDLPRHSPSISGHPLPLAGGRSRESARRSRGHGLDRRWHGVRDGSSTTLTVPDTTTNIDCPSSPWRTMVSPLP